MNPGEVAPRADWRPMHALILVALLAVAAFIPALRTWPLFWVAPLAGYAALVISVPPLRATFRPWAFGRVSACSVTATLVIAIGSCAVLTAFHYIVHPDMRAYGKFVPASTMGSLLVVGILFSIFNALFEEIVFRGIFFDAIESEWSTSVAVVATAVIFGYGHLHGYPPGPLGAVLAGIYGLCLGWLRAFTGGIGLPFIAHIAADATIFTIVATSGVW